MVTRKLAISATIPIKSGHGFQGIRPFVTRKKSPANFTMSVKSNSDFMLNECLSHCSLNISISFSFLFSNTCLLKSSSMFSISGIMDSTTLLTFL